MNNTKFTEAETETETVADEVADELKRLYGFNKCEAINNVPIGSFTQAVLRVKGLLQDVSDAMYLTRWLLFKSENSDLLDDEKQESIEIKTIDDAIDELNAVANSWLTQNIDANISILPKIICL